MDKFIFAMAVFAAILALIIGGGFAALEYAKQHPEILELKPAPQK